MKQRNSIIVELIDNIKLNHSIDLSDDRFSHCRGDKTKITLAELQEELKNNSLLGYTLSEVIVYEGLAFLINGDKLKH